MMKSNEIVLSNSLSCAVNALQEVEQAAACLCLDMAEGARPAGPLSSCSACGLVVAGRRPAFCTVCAKPGFEFEDVAMPAMPEAAAAVLKPEGVA